MVGLKKAIIYYTDNQLDPRIMYACQKQILKAGLPIISVSLQPLKFGTNIILHMDRGILTMFMQILKGLEVAVGFDVIFLCEHDILYHPSHFEFVPTVDNIYFYNTNVWKVDYLTGHALRVDFCQQTSGLCAYRSLLYQHYKKRIDRVQSEGYSSAMGFEPGTHTRPERVDNFGSKNWESMFPNIDIRHRNNLTRSRWRKDQFRNKRFTEGWIEADSIPGWGTFDGVMKNF